MVTMKRLRKETGTTQAELAKRSGVNHVYLGGLERGEHSPTIDMLHRLLSAMNISYVRFASEFT